MFLNYLKTAVRNLLRNRRHAILNISGLGVALAACIVIFLVLRFEYSHNKHLVHYSYLYQVGTSDSDGEGEHFTGGVPFPALDYLRLDFPDYTFGQLMQNYGAQVTVRNPGINNPAGNKFLESQGIYYADPPIADLFELKFLAGDKEVLKEVNNVVLSRSQAEKYFGDWKDAVGKSLNLDNARTDLVVAGIFEDVPQNCDFPFLFLASYAGFVANNGNGWPLKDWGSNTSNHQVYVRLPQNADFVRCNAELAHFERKHNSDNRQTTRKHFLLPMAEVHFDERIPANGDHQTSRSSLYSLASIGILILLMACINFVNLSTALAANRSKEVGVRKVLGGTRLQVRIQVFIETGVVVFVAVFLAIILSWISLPYIKNVMVVQSPLSLMNLDTILYTLFIALITIVLSGFYPAFVMGSFSPVEAIKNRFLTTRVGSISLRRVLVIVQFAFSQVLIIATIIAVSQMDYIQKADLGFKKEAVLVLHGNSDSASLARQEAFKNELLARSDVKSVAYGFDAPSSNNSWQSNFAFDNREDRDFNVNIKMGDENYLKTYGIQLVAGKPYEASDTVRAYLVNETFTRKVGLKRPEDAVGKLLRLGGQAFKPVCGVVKDFHVQSLRENVPAIVLHINKRYSGTAGVKLASTNLLKTQDEIRALWDKFFPEYVYNADFLDDSINQFYLREQRISLMYKVYACLAIFISFLGLYGLVSYMAVQKTKEVGIRKVLGASIQNIITLFSKEFTVLVAVAFVLAAPVGWFTMNSWLEDFAYKVTIGPGVFLLAIVFSALIAWITVGYKAFQAAVANPVKSLRTE